MAFKDTWSCERLSACFCHVLFTFQTLLGGTIFLVDYKTVRLVTLSVRKGVSGWLQRMPCWEQARVNADRHAGRCFFANIGMPREPFLHLASFSRSYAVSHYPLVSIQ